MKKFSLLTLLVVVVSLTSFAQREKFRKFKGSLTLGYAVPADGGGGVAFALEPAYRISDQLAAGLRIESAATVRDLEGEETRIAATGSYTVNGQYYFSDEKFRPFAGLGLGWFIPASIEFDDESEEGASGGFDPDGTFGFYPRVGFDYGHFTFIVDYNVISKSEVESSVTVNGQTSSSKVELKNSYASIKIGVTFGGGRK